ncbi:MAG: DUF4236 domain-containing protein [Planctomycetota bacterium]|nr:DUF4236 domain-containing protein [Planctomycetota bacterium]
MGWSFRKSINLGPFRVNMSRSGLGYSVGAGGFRTGVRANGRRYSSASIPGTGIRYTSGGSKRGTSSGCLVMIVAGIGASCAACTLLF